MILVDPRTGSKELLTYIKRYDVEAQLADPELDFGDFAFWGNGEDKPVLVGFERKEIGDFLNSMRDNRLTGHQLPGMADLYDYSFLIIEGQWRMGKGFQVLTPQGRRGQRAKWAALKAGGTRIVVYPELSNFLASIQMFTPVRVVRTYGPPETAAVVVSWYRWFQKEWIEHRSYEAIYAPSKILESRRAGFSMRHVPLVEKMATQLPGVGASARDVGETFGNAVNMVNASEEEWAEIRVTTRGKKGKGSQRLGNVRAEKIWKGLRE